MGLIFKNVAQKKRSQRGPRFVVHLRFYSVIFYPFGPFGLCWFILVYLDIFLCIYIMEKDMFGLKAPNLNPNLLKNIVRL